MRTERIIVSSSQAQGPIKITPCTVPLTTSKPTSTVTLSMWRCDTPDNTWLSCDRWCQHVLINTLYCDRGYWRVHACWHCHPRRRRSVTADWQGIERRGGDVYPDGAWTVDHTLQSIEIKIWHRSICNYIMCDGMHNNRLPLTSWQNSLQSPLL